MQFALNDASVTAIVACASASNRGSLRVLEKLGLVKVGEVLLPDSAELTIKLARVLEHR
jgi:RimJ/RimL family protein N-acetyltransferase